MRLDLVECVSFLLVDRDMLLLERRRMTAPTDPGALAIPGGHCEEGESPDQALHRELQEELALTAQQIRYIATFLHASRELQRIHYYALDAWQGDMANNEAEALFWYPITDADQLALAPADRAAIAEYLRLRG